MTSQKRERDGPADCEIRATPEMLRAGFDALILSCDPQALICEITSEDLAEVYRAMRHLESGFLLPDQKRKNLASR
jgi:hypothetical protein